MKYLCCLLKCKHLQKKYLFELRADLVFLLMKHHFYLYLWINYGRSDFGIWETVLKNKQSRTSRKWLEVFVANENIQAFE